MKSFFSIFLLLLAFVININSQPVLTVSKQLLNQSNEIIEISWTFTNVSVYDVIAIYSPSNSNITNPLGYIQLSGVSSTWKNGYGTYSFPVLNARSDYIFRLFVPGTGEGNETITPFPNITMISAATSDIVSFINPNQPGKSYLSLTNSTNEIRLMWVSGTNQNPTVFYGTSENSLSQTVIAISNTYTIEQMCGYPANSTDYFRDPGYIHDAVMTGLSPNIKYYYYYGSENDGWSPIYSFIGPPLSGSGSEAFVIAYGDLGTSFPFIATVETQYPATETMQGIFNSISLSYNTNPFARTLGLYNGETGYDQSPFWNIHHIGDISYARGIAWIWDYYLDSMTTLTSQASYMVTVGNHEYDYPQQPFRPTWSNYGTDSGGECGIPYSTRYHMPGVEDSPNRNDWYSYNQGPIHFTVMSAEHDFLEGSEQYNWLVQDLASVDRTQTPWVIFSGHRPFYVSSLQEGEYNMTLYLRETYEPVFMKYDVNLVLTGHVHIYERTAGIYNFTIAPSDNDAPVYVVVGMAGNTFQTPYEGSDINSEGNGHEDQPEWSIFRAIDYGYSRIYANTSSLYFEFVSNHRYLVHDSFWLQSKYSN